MSISSVTSEALQLKLRQLLPSQQGFGTDLSASDTIIPVIDLTEAAEGSDVRADLQSSFSFGGITAFSIQNTSSVIINNTGFYRVFGQASARTLTGSSTSATFSFSDGTSSKNLVVFDFPATNTESHDYEMFDFLVFLTAGESFSGATTNAVVSLIGSTRQIADANGVLVNPVGFNPQ